MQPIIFNVKGQRIYCDPGRYKVQFAPKLFIDENLHIIYEGLDYKIEDVRFSVCGNDNYFPDRVRFIEGFLVDYYGNADYTWGGSRGESPAGKISSIAYGRYGSDYVHFEYSYDGKLSYIGKVHIDYYSDGSIYKIGDTRIG